MVMTKEDTRTCKGSCLCGGVAFELSSVGNDELKGVTLCHCSRCRKTRGTGHAVNLITSLEALRYTRGEDLLTIFKPTDAKHFTHAFCRLCGSTMPRFDHERGFAVVPMGSLDEDPGLRPSRHIHVGSKAAWETIHDDLPTFDASPPAIV